MSADAFVKTCIAPNGTTCLCGDNECSGLTAAFSILKDARQRFIDIPNMNDVRQKQAYLRHVRQSNRGSNYLALHHFHPVILREDSHNIPKTLSLGKAVEMRMQMNEKDKLTLANGMPALFFFPDYQKSLVRQDLENLDPQTRIPETASVIQKEEDTPIKKKESYVEILDIPEQVAIGEDELSEVSSIELDLEEENVAITFQELLEATIVCQNFVRLYQAKDTMEQKKREQNDKVVLQSSVRGWSVFSEMARKNKRAGMLIQTRWRVRVAEDAMKNTVEAAEVAVEEAQKMTSMSGDADTNDTLNITTFYSLEELKAGMDGVDFSKREQYLSPKDFESMFGMSKEEFNGLRKWKQQLLKRKVGLF